MFEQCTVWFSCGLTEHIDTSVDSTEKKAKYAEHGFFSSLGLVYILYYPFLVCQFSQVNSVPSLPSCGPGMEPASHGCQDINECVWSPCLNGGSCMNQPASYVCLCGLGHYGENCQWSRVVPVESVSLVTLVASAAAATVFILVMFGVW